MNSELGSRFNLWDTPNVLLTHRQIEDLRRKNVFPARLYLHGASGEPLEFLLQAEDGMPARELIALVSGVLRTSPTKYALFAELDCQKPPSRQEVVPCERTGEYISRFHLVFVEDFSLGDDRMLSQENIISQTFDGSQHMDFIFGGGEKIYRAHGDIEFTGQLELDSFQGLVKGIASGDLEWPYSGNPGDYHWLLLLGGDQKVPMSEKSRQEMANDVRFWSELVLCVLAKQ